MNAEGFNYNPRGCDHIYTYYVLYVIEGIYTEGHTYSNANTDTKGVHDAFASVLTHFNVGADPIHVMDAHEGAANVVDGRHPKWWLSWVHT